LRRRGGQSCKNEEQFNVKKEPDQLNREKKRERKGYSTYSTRKKVIPAMGMTGKRE